MHPLNAIVATVNSTMRGSELFHTGEYTANKYNSSFSPQDLRRLN